MADAFYGEIRAFPYTFAPYGWELCDGHMLNISQNGALYALLGTKFGGNGQTTFAVPNLQGLLVVQNGTSLAGVPYPFAQTVGTNTVQLSPSQVPQHTHPLIGRVSSAPITGMTQVAANTGASMLSRPLTTGNLSFNGFDKPPITAGQETNFGLVISPVGGNGAGPAAEHDNMMPYLTLRYFICNDGQFPIPAN